MEGVRPNIRTHVYQALSNEASYGKTLVVAAAQLIPIDELIGMSIDTVALLLQEAVGINLEDTLQIQKLEVCLSIMADPSLFYEDVVCFIDACNVLSGSEIDPDTYDPADPLEMSWAVTELKLLGVLEDDDVDPWSTEIKKYVGLTLTDFGHMKPPVGLDMAAMPEGVNPAMALADQPDMVTASIAKQDTLNSAIAQEVQARLAELAEQLTPFQRSEPTPASSTTSSFLSRAATNGKG